MTKTLTPAMLEHIQGTVTTLASCWLITRVDGTIYGFTGHDQDLIIDGLTYMSGSSFDRSAVESDPTMSVDNLEIQGIISNDALDESELRAGLFDKAAVELFLVNWADLSMGKIPLRRGWLGEVTLTPSGIFKSEIRGLLQVLSQHIGEVYTTQCRADLGDSRCRIPTNPPVISRDLDVVAFNGVMPAFYRKADLTLPQDGSSAVYHDVIFQCIQEGTTAATDVHYDYTVGAVTVDGSAEFQAWPAWSRYGVVTSSTGNQTFDAFWPYGIDARVTGGVVPDANPPTGAGGDTGSGPGLVPSPDTWFVDGILTWETGQNAGLSMEVQYYTNGPETFTLHLAMGFPIKEGDKFRVYAGCSKLIGVSPSALQVVSVYGTFPGAVLTVTDPDGCFPKFNNAENFRGEPYIPGVDFLVGEASINKPGFTTQGGKK